MIPDEINKKIKQAFIAEMQDKYHLVDTDYNDSFNHSAKTVQECVNRQDTYPLYEIIDNWISDCQFDASQTIMNELKDKILTDNKYADIHPYMKDWMNNKDNMENIRFAIIESDCTDTAGQLISRTTLRARITRYSNSEYLPPPSYMRSAYRYRDYFRDIVDALYLNPMKVKQIFIEKGFDVAGKWPDYPYRNGKEAVEYVSLATEVQNQDCYCRLVFMGMLPLQSLYENLFREPHKFIIPKGNSCGLFNSWDGSGSLLGMTLKRDLVLPVQIPRKTKNDRFGLEVDERNCIGCCIDEVYGLIHEVWGKEIQPVYRSQNRK